MPRLPCYLYFIHVLRIQTYVCNVQRKPHRRNINDYIYYRMKGPYRIKRIMFPRINFRQIMIKCNRLPSDLSLLQRVRVYHEEGNWPWKTVDSGPPYYLHWPLSVAVGKNDEWRYNARTEKKFSCLQIYRHRPHIMKLIRTMTNQSYA